MRRSAAWAIWGLGLLACPIAWVPLGLANGEGWVHAIVTTLVIPVFPTVGLVITLRLRHNAIGQLLLVAGSVMAIGSALTQTAIWLDEQGASDAVLGWVMAANNAAFLGLALVPLIVLRFPTGRPPTARWQWVDLLGRWAIVVAFPASIFGPETFDVTEERAVDNPASVGFAAIWNVMAAAAFAMIGTVAVAAAVSIIVRWRRAWGDERVQLTWVAWTASVGLLAVLVIQLTGIGGSSGVVAAMVVLLVAFPISILVAILKYRLYAIDVLVDRTILYVTMTGVLTALYFGVVSVIPAMFGSGAETTAGILAAALVAVAFAPVRNRLQLLVNHRLFGFRDEPEAALDRLGDAMARPESSDDPRAAMAEVVATSLRLPYAAIASGADTLAEYGHPVGPLAEVELSYRGDVLGRMIVSGRSASESIGARDLRVLEQLAVFVGVVVSAAAAADQLERSRSALFRAREDERRRVRRDLHDGLGPALTALGFGLDTAGNLLRSHDDAAAFDRIQLLRRQVDDAIADVRRLVHDLRPPALDDLGLTGALTAQAAALSRDGLDISVHADGDLAQLPAAVEVAAFRIASEAMNNTARHAHARSCQVSIRNNGALDIEVTDDGIGFNDTASSGVGIASMRERIEEVRGRLHITSHHGGGTTVHAIVPVDPT